MRLARASGLLVLAGLALGIAAGVARGAGDPRAQAEATLKQVEATPAHKTLAKEPLDQAHRALRRAAGARAAGDQRHGGQLEALALEWAQAASNLVRAADAERQASAIEKQAAESERKAVRARALLEETIDRRGRAEERLRQLTDGGAPAATDGGAQPAKPAKPAKPAGKAAKP